MCGFSGFIDLAISSETRDSVLKNMGAAIRHRGPDDGGRWWDDRYGLGLVHQRLSVVDLSIRSRQPMESQSGRYVIAYNGEIYNFRDLRESLKKSGVVFQTTSDTEVLLEAIDLWGLELALNRCAGMFAFALVDRKELVLYLVRDRMGEKPVYYGQQGGVFLFGSELKALRAHPKWEGGVSVEAATAMLSLGYVPSPQSIHPGIYKLGPGCLVTVEIERTTHKNPTQMPWWSYQKVFSESADPGAIGNITKIEEEFEEILSVVIAGQRIADVPVGGFLSGGVDSSLVISEMQRQAKNPIQTFTIGFDEASYDERKIAGSVSKILATDHETRILTAAEALQVIPELPAIFDEPFADPSQVPTVLLSRLASNSVKVAVSGDGGDEIFCGYNRYKWAPILFGGLKFLPLHLRQCLASVLDSIGRSTKGSIEERLYAILPSVMNVPQIAEKMSKVARIFRAENGFDVYRALTQELQVVSVKGVYDGKCAGSQAPKPGWDSARSLREMMMVTDSTTYLPDDILVKVDRAAMATSLEVRSPLLDHRLVEFAARLPLNLKLRHGKGKWILKQSLSRRLPHKLVNRPKAGFTLPIGRWLNGPLKPWAENLLEEERLKSSGIVDSDAVREIWKNYCCGKNDDFNLIWHILMFQAWYDRYEAN